jgi:hypothetical protein
VVSITSIILSMKLIVPLVLLLLIGLATKSAAQENGDAALVGRAAARFVASDLKGKAIALDTTRQTNTRHAKPAPVPARDHEALARILGTSKVGREEDFLVCSAPNNCNFHGVDAIVKIWPPMLQGDVALVKVRVMERQSEGRHGVFMHEALLRFERRAGEWLFVNQSGMAIS